MVASAIVGTAGCQRFRRCNGDDDDAFQAVVPSRLDGIGGGDANPEFTLAADTGGFACPDCAVVGCGCSRCRRSCCWRCCECCCGCRRRIASGSRFTAAPDAWTFMSGTDSGAPPGGRYIFRKDAFGLLDLGLTAGVGSGLGTPYIPVGPVGAAGAAIGGEKGQPKSAPTTPVAAARTFGSTSRKASSN